MWLARRAAIEQDATAAVCGGVGGKGSNIGRLDEDSVLAFEPLFLAAVATRGKGLPVGRRLDKMPWHRVAGA